MWHETNAQIEGIIKHDTRFPEDSNELVYSGPHICVGNPIFKTPRKISVEKGDYDVVDLSFINEQYFQRTKYTPSLEKLEYDNKVPTTNWQEKYHLNYRLIARKMLNLKQERTLNSAIVPPNTAHIHGVIGFNFKNINELVYSAGLWSSIPYDFFIKAIGKANLQFDNAGALPLPYSKFDNLIKLRALLLNCLTINYKLLWRECFNSEYINNTWAKTDFRLRDDRFSNLVPQWTWDSPLRYDYERRQALVEIDVLTSMALGMTLDQLKTIYRIQFPVLQSYEADTWYDRNGRIVFTNNRSLTGVGYSRQEWEPIRDAKNGTFTRTITDDTMPGGPVERTIEYIAPFDRCDREQDYETAWRFFEKRFKDK
jgi:hypothetical protein